MSKRPADEDNVCSFYLERKKRPCRMRKAEGKAYCPHHSHLGSEIDEKKGARIPCPYDSSHFCYESKLQKHLNICNAREREKPDYYVQNINAGEIAESDERKVSLKDIGDDELLNLVKKINLLYDESNVSITESHSSHPFLQSEMEKLSDGFNNFKHMKQQASLLSLMDSEGLLSEGSCFVEFGAGKGQLMYWIVQCVPKKENCTFVLIDRSAQRHKTDNKLKELELQLERIRIDIQHLHLGKVKNINSHLNEVVGVSKHLCGCATDLALRCLTNTLQNEEEKTSQKALGFVMALCCHHRCTWNSYVGKEFMKDKNISENDFKFMCCIASWATCGQRKADSINEDQKSIENATLEENLSTKIPSEGEVLLNRYARLNLKHEEREEIGIKCKRLIDIGRVDYLLKQGYQVKLVSYIDKCTSLENVALIGLNKDISF